VFVSKQQKTGKKKQVGYLKGQIKGGGCCFRYYLATPYYVLANMADDVGWMSLVVAVDSDDPWACARLACV
jgi:hypothetical protein